MANLNSLSSVERDHYVRAKTHFERGEIDPALEGFSQLLESRENFADIHYMVGILLEQKGELDSASHSLGRVLVRQQQKGATKGEEARCAICFR